MSALARPLSAAPAVPRARPLGRLAIASLHAELACSPKPGLVTPFSRGSHQDMDAGTFLRSLFALRGYFTAIAAQAATSADFAPLRQLGIQAERGMLAATGNVNTHRGAIFSLGLLVASAARLHAAGCPSPSADAVCQGVRQWREALLQAPLDPGSPGQRARVRHAVPGVREEAAAGFPLLREVAVPVLRAAFADGLPRDAALLQTLMQLVAVTDDLNLLHRGGAEGLAFAQAQARGFLAAGGVRATDAPAHMARICHAFELRHLSPGGSADLLACALFLLQQEAA
jgi:triphosphoribosyl-dephospho-CoA synthase